MFPSKVEANSQTYKHTFTQVVKSIFQWTFYKATEKLKNSISRKKIEKKCLKSHQRNWLYLSEIFL